MASIAILVLGYACIFMFSNWDSPKNTNAATSFYYWKTSYQLSSLEKKYVKDHSVKKIYFKAFDITTNYSKEIVPVGVMLWKQNSLEEVQYIPTVYINYAILANLTNDSINQLANKTYTLCAQMLHAQNLPFTEIQLDCDWTISMQQQYFYFIECMKKNKIIVGSTIRLYQYKYPDKAGVPPADYGALMCYNIGNIKNANADNSIYNDKELISYVKDVNEYPLPLKVALPIFSWCLLFNKDGSLQKVYNHTPDFNNGNWEKIADNQYKCKNWYEDKMNDDYFYVGCILRVENINKANIIQAQSIIKQYIPNYNEIIYFDLDSTQVATCLQ